MSYFSNIDINSPKTLFNSLDVSERTPIIELKSNYGLSKLRDIVTETNSATVSNDKTEYNLSTGTTTASVATLDSAERGRYTPGAQGQMGIGVRINETFTGTASAHWGYFDDDNGFGFGVDATGTFVFTRRAGTDTKTYQSDWNGDKLDGTGASGITLDLARGNIYQVNFSWYGYGTIEFNIFTRGDDNVQRVVTVHRFAPENQTSVADPNQPIRAIIDNGNTTTDYDMYVGGRQFSIFNEFRPNRRVNSHYRLAQGSVGTTFLPAISFRRKSAFRTVSVKVEGYDILTDANLLVQLRANATLTSPSFGAPADTTAAETACEVDTSATAVSGGELLYQALVNSSGSGATASGAIRVIDLGFDVPALQPVTLCVRTLSGTATINSVLRFKEEW